MTSLTSMSPRAFVSLASYEESPRTVVGNLYWAQPLLDGMGVNLNVSASLVGLIITAVQLGYALGVFLIVPLGDRVERHRLIPAIMSVSVLALVVTAVAPSYGVVIAAMLVVGLSSVTGQLLTPPAGDLAHPDHQGRTIAMVASGLMFGSRDRAARPAGVGAEAGASAARRLSSSCAPVAGPWTPRWREGHGTRLGDGARRGVLVVVEHVLAGQFERPDQRGQG